MDKLVALECRRWSLTMFTSALGTFELCCNFQNLTSAIILRTKRVEFSDKLDGETMMYHHLDAPTEICLVLKKRYSKPK